MSGNQYSGIAEAAPATAPPPVPRQPHELLLHVCCGPCSAMPVQRLRDEGFQVTGWFMNPNIQPLAEYLRRREAAAQCAQRLNMEIIFVDAAWDITRWLREVSGRDTAPERCAYCCRSRLEALFASARELGFSQVSTSLLYSRYQPHAYIAETGAELARQGGPAFVYRDFRTDWQAGIDQAKAWGLYRQPYCGCVYSEADRYRKQWQRCFHAATRTDSQ